MILSGGQKRDTTPEDLPTTGLEKSSKIRTSWLGPAFDRLLDCGFTPSALSFDLSWSELKRNMFVDPKNEFRIWSKRSRYEMIRGCRSSEANLKRDSSLIFAGRFTEILDLLPTSHEDDIDLGSWIHSLTTFCHEINLSYLNNFCRSLRLQNYLARGIMWCKYYIAMELVMLMILVFIAKGDALLMSMTGCKQWLALEGMCPTGWGDLS